MRPLAFVCLALLALSLPARCQNGTGILTEPGLVLRAAPPRQLTLGAHIIQFFYQPGGDGIAYVGIHDDDGKRTFAIKFVGTHQKDPYTRTLYSLTGDSPDAQSTAPKEASLDLQGWSADGRSLIFQQLTPGEAKLQYFCGDIGTSNFQVRPIPMSTTDSQGIVLSVFSAWSPSRRQFLITALGTGPAQATTAELYDPARDEVKPVAVPDGMRVWGWLDDGHLLFDSFAGANSEFLSYDVVTGVDTEIVRPAPWPPIHGSSIFHEAAPPTTPKAPGLTLEVQPQTFKDTQGVAETKAQAIWLRKAKAPKAMSALSVGVTPGEYDPQAQWSPEGDAVAFVAHADLFVAALTVQEATPREKVAAGEKLDCAEEKQIIMSNLSQLGLGVIQYTQDNDETFPPASGWHDAVFPYIKDETIFNFPGVPIAYHMPPGKTLASVASPADAVLATADTPCAHIVLYVDGHVHAFDKSAGPPP